jgi:hypothetical protein
MQYYEPTTTTRHTASQLERRDLLLSDDDLKSIGIYKLVTEQPYYNPDYQQLTNERVAGDAETGFHLEWDIEYLPLEQVKRAKQSEITAAHDAFLKSQSAEYSDMERQTWDMQRAEAEALLADAKAPAPLVRSIAAARGMKVITLAKHIQANTAAWAALAGHATGQRLALQDKVTAAKTAEDVVKIDVVFSAPKSSAEDE